jgi:hypothetical protein
MKFESGIDENDTPSKNKKQMMCCLTLHIKILNQNFLKQIIELKSWKQQSTLARQAQPLQRLFPPGQAPTLHNTPIW